jgi:hypothetical protein
MHALQLDSLKKFGLLGSIIGTSAASSTLKAAVNHVEDFEELIGSVHACSIF